MTQYSIFWDTDTTGDGTSKITQAQATEFWNDIFTRDNDESEGVHPGVGGELAVTAAVESVDVASGRASAAGFSYKNTVTENVAIPVPAANTRIDRIVLRAVYAPTRTVRITRIAGTEGAGAPALTQSAGSTWDIPLAQVSITTGAAITVTDERSYCHFATRVSTVMLDDNAVTNAKLRDSSPQSVIGRATNTTGDPADIVASVDNRVLKRAAGSLSFAQVDTNDIANDAVDYTKVGGGLGQFLHRQGGSSTAWDAAGTNNYGLSGTQSKIQFGVYNQTLDPGVITTFLINFPTAFTNDPFIMAVPSGITVTSGGDVPVGIDNLSGTTTYISGDLRTANGQSGSGTVITIFWLAIGALA